MKKYVNRCEVVPYEGRGHGFFNYNKGTNPDFLSTMENTVKFLTSIGYIKRVVWRTAKAEPAQDSIFTQTIPLFSGLHTLSIHVRDTITHDSVFHFLVDKLKLPVYYYPIAFGNRKWVGVYAGNLVLEPCGPYKDISNLQKWKELISPFELSDKDIWKESNLLEFHIIKSNIKEVQSITFKVKSLEKAKQYLVKNNLFGSCVDNKIQLDKAQAFGLSIYLTESVTKK